MRARVREILFFTDNFFYHLTNLDSVLKDGVCLKSETKSHYFIATLYSMSPKVEVVVIFYHKEQKV